jgi:hypothetical protein
LRAIELVGFLDVDNLQPAPILIMLKLGKMVVKHPRQTLVRSAVVITV